MDKKVYVGFRAETGCKVYVWDGMDLNELEPCNDIRNHSPAGFEWGYGGSGPAQLALALCCDLLGANQQAQAIYQEVKRRVVGYLPHDVWRLDADVLHDVISLAWTEYRQQAYGQQKEPENGD